MEPVLGIYGSRLQGRDPPDYCEASAKMVL